MFNIINCAKSEGVTILSGGTVFVGISAPFKLRNIINGRTLKDNRKLLLWFHLLALLIYKAFTLQTEEFQIAKCNMGILSVPVTSIASRRPRLDTDRQDGVVLSRLSALLKTPCWKPLCSEPSHPTMTEPTALKAAKHLQTIKNAFKSHWGDTFGSCYRLWTHVSISSACTSHISSNCATWHS